MAIILIRTLIVFVSITAALRLMGKRQMGELELSELVVAILISDLAANPLQDIGIPLLNGLLPIIVLLCCEVLISGLTMHSVRFRALLYGKPSIIVENGVIIEREMRRNRLTLDELTEELRSQGISDISKIKYAVLETNGELSCVLFPGEQPVTAAQLGLSVPDPGHATIIINDGRVLSGNLRRLGKSDQWLRRELKKRGSHPPEEVYLMSVDELDQIYYQPKEGKNET